MSCKSLLHIHDSTLYLIGDILNSLAFTSFKEQRLQPPLPPKMHYVGQQMHYVWQKRVILACLDAAWLFSNIKPLSHAGSFMAS